MKQHEHSSLAERLACPSCLRSTAPAADAGPRQPCPHVNTMGHEWASRCQDCGEVWTHALPPGYTVTIPAPKGTCDVHEGLHSIYPNCVNYQNANPPVPQEAAPRLPSGLSKGAGYKTLGAFPVPCATNSSEQATAPDGAMRVAREITTRWQKWQVAYAGNFAGCDTHGGPVPPTEREVAALIRQAGSERERVENDPNYWFYFADRVGEKIGWPFTKLEELAEILKTSRPSRLLGGESK